MRRLTLAVALVAAIALGAPVEASAGSVTFSTISSLPFDSPMGGSALYSAFLPNGRLLVTDSGSGEVTEMNPDGSGETTFVSGLKDPRSIAVDPVHGFVYVAELGDGSFGSDVLVRFNLRGTDETTYNVGAQPLEVAVDGGGNVLVAVSGTGEIEELQFNWTTDALSTMSSIGPVTPMSNLQAPTSIAISPAGDVYIGEYASIYVLPTGSSTWVSLNSSAVAPNETTLAFSNGELLVSYNTFTTQSVSYVDAFPIVGSGASQSLGTPTTLETFNPDSITVAPSGISGVDAGSLFFGGQIPGVLDATPSSYTSSLVESAPGSGLTPLAFTGSSAMRYSALAYDPYSASLLAVDAALGTVVSMDTDGSDQKVLIRGYDVQTVGLPEYLAVDPSTGTIFVSSTDGHVESYPPSGGTVATGSVLSGTSFPWDAEGIAVLQSKLFVAMGSSVYVGNEDGSGFSVLETLHGYAHGLTASPGGELYAAVGSDGGSLAGFGPTGGTQTILPLPDGASPTYVAVDTSGRVFVADAALGPGNLDEVSTSGLGAQQIAFSSGTIGVAADGSGGVYTADDLTIDDAVIPPVPTLSSLSTSAAPRGSAAELTLRGTNFEGASTVEFQHGAAAYFTTPTSAAAASLTVTVPTIPAGRYAVIVVTPGGASVPSSATRFDNEADTPTISRLAPGAGATTGGQRVTIKGIWLAHAVSVDFGGVVVKAARLLKDTSTSIVLKAPAHPKAARVSVTVTTKLGRSAGASYDYVRS